VSEGVPPRRARKLIEKVNDGRRIYRGGRGTLSRWRKTGRCRGAWPVASSQAKEGERNTGRVERGTSIGADQKSAPAARGGKKKGFMVFPWLS